MAEQIIGSKYHSYNFAADAKINIDDLIFSLNVEDLPLLTGVGSNGNTIMPRLPVDNREFFWMQQDVPLPRGALGAAMLIGAATATLVATQGPRFAIGDVIRIDAEFMLITANAADVLTVTRGVSGSAAAAHLISSEVLGVGTVLAEGEIGSANFQGRDRISNFTQIFSKKIEVTRTEMKIPKYGVPSELNLQIANNMLNLNVGIEQAALYSTKWEDQATQRRQTGGLMEFITSNVDPVTDWLSITTIEDRLQAAYDVGGYFDTIMARAISFQALTNLAGVERIQTVTIDDPRRGRVQARTVITEFGETMLVRNRWMRATDAVGYNRQNFIMRVFDPLVLTKLAKTKDTESFMMVTELGFQVKGQAHMTKWTGLDPNAVLPADLV